MLTPVVDLNHDSLVKPHDAAFFRQLAVALERVRTPKATSAQRLISSIRSLFLQLRRYPKPCWCVAWSWARVASNCCNFGRTTSRALSMLDSLTASAPSVAEHAVHLGWVHHPEHILLNSYSSC